jgi:hypothetical protein
MPAVTARIACALLAAVTLAGCEQEGAGDVEAPRTTASSPTAGQTLPARIVGQEVAQMAEQELEAENSQIAPGAMVCPDLDLEVGASVRCLRTVQLPEGRIVRIPGTVAVMSLASGGRLHVALDDDAEEFGVGGEYLAAAVRKRYAELFRVRATGARCPYLPGTVGASITCKVKVGDVRRAVRVTVTATVPADYRTTYTIDAGDTIDPGDPAS